MEGAPISTTPDISDNPTIRSDQAQPSREKIFKNGVRIVSVTLIGFICWLVLFQTTKIFLNTLGVFICAVNLVQWFCLLHEAGHSSLFTSTRLNTLLGWFAGVLTLTPFVSWQRVHKLHHIWTGWKDKDPTTSLVIPRQISSFSRVFINTFWFTRFPIFSLLYRVNNFWNIVRLFRIFGRGTDRIRLFTCFIFTALLSAGAFIFLGFSFTVMFCLGYFFHHVLLEPVMLSQHSHIKQNVAALESVKPYAPQDQLVFTRSLLVPGWISRWVLFGFEKHIEHHLFQNVPGEFLLLSENSTAKRISFWTWLRESRRMSGVDLLFSTAEETGWPH